MRRNSVTQYFGRIYLHLHSFEPQIALTAEDRHFEITFTNSSIDFYCALASHKIYRQQFTTRFLVLKGSTELLIGNATHKSYQLNWQAFPLIWWRECMIASLDPNDWHYDQQLPYDVDGLANESLYSWWTRKGFPQVKKVLSFSTRSWGAQEPISTAKRKIQGKMHSCLLCYAARIIW